MSLGLGKLDSQNRTQITALGVERESLWQSIEAPDDLAQGCQHHRRRAQNRVERSHNQIRTENRQLAARMEVVFGFRFS